MSKREKPSHISPGTRSGKNPTGDSAVEFYEDELLDGPLLPRRLSMAIRRALIYYYRYYLFTIRLLLEHYLKLQRTKIATPRKIIVPKNLDFTDPVYRKNSDFHSQNSAPSCTNISSVSRARTGCRHRLRRKQGRGAVSFVIVGDRAGAPLLHRQARLGAVERLDLALLIDRQNHGVVRRIDIEADDVAQFGRRTSERQRLLAIFPTARKASN
jgi:hypothetical protein